MRLGSIREFNDAMKGRQRRFDRERERELERQRRHAQRQKSRGKYQRGRR